ncbi:MAG: HAMP domain-containing histidine kinase [Campylobacterales bacterium]|nr:HAMP domain-containing histidine kinase [Campylobacterales bacterium]
MYGNGTDLVQAFVNIINNTKEKLEQSDMANKYIFIDAYKVNQAVEMQIYDNAGGIEPELIERIFEPYFTTYHKEQGKGLGLYVVQQILLQTHKAKLEVSNKEFQFNSQNYKGLCFKITFEPLS